MSGYIYLLYNKGVEKSTPPEETTHSGNIIY